MAFDINNFAIDRIIRGVMVNKAGEYMWSINQITNPALNVTTENSQVVDALGGVIAEFDRARNAELSAENSLFDLGLYAAQMGKEKNIASVTNKIVVPAFETIDIVLDPEDTTGATVLQTYELKHTPKEDVEEIYKLKGDGTLMQAYKVASAASATEFVYDKDAHKITIPSGMAAGDQIFVMYEYDADEAVEVVADAINFPKKGKFIMEVLGTDVCDQETLIHAFVVFGNAKLDSNVDYTFSSDGTHPFVIRAQQAYCDKEKKLFRIVIPAED